MTGNLYIVTILNGHSAPGAGLAALNIFLLTRDRLFCVTLLCFTVFYVAAILVVYQYSRLTCLQNELYVQLDVKPHFTMPMPSRSMHFTVTVQTCTLSECEWTLKPGIY